MYDLAARDRCKMMHTISDLKACYDRQLPNIGCLVEEAIGVEHEPAKLFARILPVMNHYICTSFGISENYYGSDIFKLGGTGQGNSASGAICRDTSCIIFKKIEKEGLGVIMRLPLSFEEFTRCVIAFVNDIDFYTNNKDFQEKMQLLMDMYTRLYEATGGKIQESKILYYCWKWGYEKGRRLIKQVETELFVYGERIECIEPTKSTRILGVHINPSLSWDDQFEVMRKKLHISITKMMNTDVNAY